MYTQAMQLTQKNMRGLLQLHAAIGKIQTKEPNTEALTAVDFTE